MLDSQPNRDMCMRQLMRMAGLPGFPSAEEAMNELLETLVDSCRDEKHLAATVTAWVRSQQWAPRPVDLAMQAAEFQEPERVYPKCSQCGNSGLSSQRMLVTRRTHGGKYDVDPLPEPQNYAELQAQNARVADGQEIMQFSDYCACPRGRRMREANIAEDARKAAKSPIQKQGKRASDDLRRGSATDYKMAAGGGD